MIYINNWIINITTAVFFIIAVEMILPNNSIKKYVSFVLGLILIIIMMNPLIKFFNREFDFTKYLTNTMKYVEVDNNNKSTYDEYKTENMNETLKNFKINIENVSTKKLNTLYPENNYEIDAEVKYDMLKNTITIGKIKIGVKIGRIKRIKKVEISDKCKNDKQDILNNKLSKSIKKCLGTEFNISEDNIVIYEL